MENKNTVKTFTFLVCRPSGKTEFADITAMNPAEAVRRLVAMFPKCRANIIGIY